MYYKKVKKQKIDICNICGQKAKLSWEHVPPECCGNSGDYKINRLFKLDDINEKLDSQNGIKYRTICERCNNYLLGTKADKEFQNFYDQTLNFVEGLNSINEEKVIEINLVEVLKCLFGKLLAMGETYAEDKVSNSMRDFILEDKLNDNLHVYFRIYPFNTSIQARSYVSKQVSGTKYHTDGLISVLYYYPVAFVVSNKKENINLTDLTEYVNFEKPNINLQISALSAFNPLTKKLLPYDWLVSTDDGYIIMSSKDFVNVVATKKIKD